MFTARPVRRTSHLARVTTALLAASALTVTGILVAATPAGADAAVSACAYTDSNHVNLTIDTPPGQLGNLSNVGTVTLTDPQGNVLGTTTSVSLLDGQLNIALPNFAVPEGLSGINYSVAPIPNLAGVMNPIVGNTPCAALPIQPVTGSYEPLLTPLRLLDTRAGVGSLQIPIPALGLITVLIPKLAGIVLKSGLPGLPGSTPSAVNINFTATNAVAAGFLTVYPTGTTRPLASNLNFAPGHDVANTTIASLGADGTITIYNGSANAVDLIGDVAGYYYKGLTSSVVPLLPGAYQPLGTQVRLLDTRTRGAAGKLAYGHSMSFPVTNQFGVPATAGSVVLNVTSTNATANGHLRAYPTGSALPFASNVNFTTNRTVANEVVVAPGDNGEVSLFNGGPTSTTDVVVDVIGYIVGGPVPVQTPGLENAVTPHRLLDTRFAIGTPVAGAVAAGAVKVVKVAGIDGVPSHNVRAAVITVTSTDETQAGYATVYAGGARPTTSILNFLVNTDVANVMMVPIAADGTISIFNGAAGPANMVIDISAYITGPTLSIG